MAEGLPVFALVEAREGLKITVGEWFTVVPCHLVISYVFTLTVAPEGSLVRLTYRIPYMQRFNERHKGVAHSSVVPTGSSSGLAYYADRLCRCGFGLEGFLELSLTLKHDFCFKVIIEFAYCDF